MTVQLLIFLVLGLLAATVLAHVIAGAAFAARARALADTIATGPPTTATEPPAAIRAFALRNGADPAAGHRALRLVQEAEFRMGLDRPWAPMPATQHVALGAAGFVWNARQPGLVVPRFTVIDAYVGGKGLLRAALFGSVPVANASGAVIDRSEAMRYLAELPWAPDALIGNPELRWSVLSDSVLEVSLALDPEPAAVRLILDEAGDIVRIEADRPNQNADGSVTMRPWRGRFTEYAWMGGRRIPVAGEVGYLDDGDYKAYWRGRITGYTLLP